MDIPEIGSQYTYISAIYYKPINSKIESVVLTAKIFTHQVSEIFWFVEIKRFSFFR